MDGQKVIGIVGGGQLGRMLTLAALPLGFKVVVVDPSENCPAAQVGAQQIIGNLQDAQAIQKLAKVADYITVEIEHLNTTVLENIERSGIPVNPQPQTIRLIQDKYKQKEFLEAKGFAVAEFRQVDTIKQANEAFKYFGGSMMLKTRHNAYDGRGNALIKNGDELKTAWKQFAKTPLYAEKIMPFMKELAVMVAKDMNGNVHPYQVVETVHERNICVEVYSPAPVSQKIQQKAMDIATKAVSQLKGAGMYGVELFLLANNSIIINEIAPRVHNSGHITMNACSTSQFEQHVRAVTGLPLGDMAMITSTAVMINILGERNGPAKLTGLKDALSDAGVYVHLYGKSPTKPDRKMGHINVLGKTLDDTLKVARQARKNLEI